MINVNKITSTLAKLPDQQLQQYAQMHKSDPYIMALAMSESNRRKEMRSAGQGAQGMQEQPKVVDQMVADMAPQQLPEDQGIGQLNAGEMNFAGGGIIAFADGGDVERFNGSQSQFVQDLMGLPQQYTEYQQRVREEDARRAESDRRMAEAKRQRLEAQQKTSFANYLFGSPEREAEGKTELAQLSATPVGAPARSGTMPEPGYTRPGMLNDPRLNTPSSAPASTGAAALKVDAGRKGPGAPGAAPAAGKPAAAGFREQYLKDLEGMAPEKTKTLEEIRAERAALMPKEKAYAGLEAALNKETEGAAGEKQDAIWMAVTQAGLAAAAGTSTSALKNIADGFGTGLAGYKESLKEFKKADKERQKAMADIEQARRAEERGDTDAAISLREKSQDRMDKFNDRKAAGLAAITGSEISAAASKYSADSSAAASRAAANRTPAELQLIERYGSDPKFAAAYDKFAQAKREPQTQETLMKAWSSNMLLQQQYPNPQDYIKMMAGSSADAGTGGFKVVGVRNP
jgi:hypothetical protein